MQGLAEIRPNLSDMLVPDQARPSRRRGEMLFGEAAAREKAGVPQSEMSLHQSNKGR